MPVCMSMRNLPPTLSIPITMVPVTVPKYYEFLKESEKHVKKPASHHKIKLYN